MTTRVYIVMYQEDWGSRTEIRGVFFKEDKAIRAVHDAYREEVPLGGDFDRGYEVSTTSGLRQEEPEESLDEDDLVFRFGDDGNGAWCWYKTMEVQ